MPNIQTELLYYINNTLQNPFLDQIAPIIYHIADVKVTLILIILAVIISWKLKKDKIFKLAALCLIGFLVSSLFVGLGKTFYPSPRPFMVLDGIRLAVIDNGYYSFPSGHFADTVMVLSIILMKTKKYRKFLFVPAIAYVMILAFVVMYGGVHYPIDVIGGGTIGLISAIITVSYLDFIVDYIINFLNDPRESLKLLKIKLRLKD
ncbi:phosphatase PAP2 family protein [Methanobrevibacter sp.]|uniref:phosphatase PAP2 family protein n=1 Tax=Methanobrevibacter sp. TaxID=66852 RepID=UPI00388FE222